MTHHTNTSDRALAIHIGGPSSPSPSSPFPTSAPPAHTHPPLLSPPAHAHPTTATAIPARTPLPFLCTLLQFLLGAYLWVTGQSIGSLSCTGLGYWVVFDAFGVGQGAGVLGAALARTGKGGVRRPYGYVFYLYFHLPFAPANRT